MQDRIVLMTVRYEKKAPSAGKKPVFVLVSTAQTPWSPVATNVQPGELPLEAAVRAGEALFGYGSVSSIWLLGRVKEQQTTHYYCLDTDSLGTDPVDNIEGHTWVSLDDVIHHQKDSALPLVEKMRAYENS